MPPARLDPRDVRIDPLLSQISTAYINRSYIAPMLAPVIPSDLDGGRYTEYNQADWFRNEAAKRAVGTRARRGEYGITFSTFFCEEVAFAREVPDEVRQNAMQPIRPDTDATNYATDKVLLAKEVRVATKLRTAANWSSTQPLAGTAQWNDYGNSDPITDIENGMDLIHGRTGYDANTMVLPHPVWKKLKHHPDIIDRIKYSQRGFVNVELLQELFDIPRIMVAKPVYTTGNEGLAVGSETYQYVWGKDVWIGYITGNPGLQEPTAMYQFVSGQRSTRRWREEPEHQDVVEAYEKVDEKVVSALLGHLITTAVA